MPHGKQYRSNRSGSAILDGAPPSPPDKVLHTPSPPGADSRALLGEREAGGSQMGGAMAEPANKILLGVSMFMEAANIIDSVMPGFVPDPVKMWIAQAMEQAPQAVEQLQSQKDPTRLLSAVGSAAPAGGPAPTGLPAMGRSAAPSAGMSAGGPAAMPPRV